MPVDGAKLDPMATRVRRRLAALSPRSILLIGTGLFTIHAYPGLMAPGSLVQLDEARAGVFSDLHPPLMQALWWVLDRIVPGPFGMLMLQSVGCLAGAYLIARRLVQPRAAAVGAVLVLLLPPVLAVMAVVCEQALFAGLALFGAGLVVDGGRRTRVLGLVVLAAAAGVRHDAAAATLPLIVVLLAPQLRGVWWRRYAIAVAAWLATTIAACGVNTALTAREHDVTVVHADDQDRLATFGAVLGLTGELPIVTRESQSVELLRAAEIQQASSPLQRLTGRVVGALATTILFEPWCYLVLAIAMLVKLRREPVLRALLASGIALELSLAYSAHGAGYASSHWLVTCALLVAAIAVARRFSPSPREPAATAAHPPPDPRRTAPPPDPT